MCKDSGSSIDILLVAHPPSGNGLLANALLESFSVRSVALVADGARAIQYLSRQGVCGCAPSPAADVVFLDLKTAGDGFAMLQWFHAHPQCCAAPVMVLSSLAGDEDLERAYQLGAPVFFKTPIVARELSEVLEMARERRRLVSVLLHPFEIYEKK